MGERVLIMRRMKSLVKRLIRSQQSPLTGFAWSYPHLLGLGFGFSDQALSCPALVAEFEYVYRYVKGLNSKYHLLTVNTSSVETWTELVINSKGLQQPSYILTHALLTLLPVSCPGFLW